MLVPKRQRSSTYYFEKEKDLNSSALIPANTLKNSGFEENSFMRRSNKNKSPYNSLNGRRESFSKNKNEIIEYDKMQYLKENVIFTPNESSLNNLNVLQIDKNNFNDRRTSFAFSKSSLNNMNMILNESQTAKNSTKQPINYKNLNENLNGGGSILLNDIESFKNTLHKYKLECANLRLENSKLKKKNSELEDKNCSLIEKLEKMELNKEKDCQLFLKLDNQLRFYIKKVEEFEKKENGKVNFRAENKNLNNNLKASIPISPLNSVIQVQRTDNMKLDKEKIINNSFKCAELMKKENEFERPKVVKKEQKYEIINEKGNSWIDFKKQNDFDKIKLHEKEKEIDLSEISSPLAVKNFDKRLSFEFQETPHYIGHSSSKISNQDDFQETNENSNNQSNNNCIIDEKALDEEKAFDILEKLKKKLEQDLENEKYIKKFHKY